MHVRTCVALTLRTSQMCRQKTCARLETNTHREPMSMQPLETFVDIRYWELRCCCLSSCLLCRLRKAREVASLQAHSCISRRTCENIGKVMMKQSFNNCGERHADNNNNFVVNTEASAGGEAGTWQGKGFEGDSSPASAAHNICMCQQN